MKLKCPRCLPVSKDLALSSKSKQRSVSGLCVRFGSYYRRSDSRVIRRFLCRRCGHTFSNATFSDEYGQLKRRLNSPIRKLLCSGVSQRDVARTLGINRKTVVRKFLFLSEKSRIEHHAWVRAYAQSGLMDVVFDEMETFEHTKCKPLSIPLAVSLKDRKILALGVGRFPAKGPLTHVARKRYGPRVDERPQKLSTFFMSLATTAKPHATFTSDRSPFYPKPLHEHFPNATHVRHKGRSGCVTGQGELKSGGFDPLFVLNHTCAMLRAHMNRLFRRTWCTTKKPERLEAHLWLYAHYHNTVLTE